MGANQNQAKPLVEKIWGTNFLDSIPPKWKAAVRLLRTKIPGVPNGTDPDVPDTVTAGNLTDDLIATSQVTTNRTNELEKMTERIQAGLLLESVAHGQERDETFNLVIPYTEHLSLDGVEIGDAGKDINPLNPILSEVREVDTTAFAAVLNTYLLSFPGTSNVDAPDFLEEIKVYTESTIGDADSTEDVLTLTTSGNYSYTIPIRQTAQGSAAITKEVIPMLVPIGGVKRSTIHYMFFLPAPVTHQQVADKLAALTGLSVVSWPRFTPKPLTIVIISKRISLRVDASYTTHHSISDDGSATVITGGTGSSREISLTVKTIRIPPTVHANLSIGGVGLGSSGLDVTLDSSNLTVTALAGTQTLTKTEKASCRIIAEGLLATSGAVALPGTGLLIIDTNARPYKHGYVMIQAEVIDASTL